MANNPVMNSVAGQKINNVIDPGKTFDLQCDPNEIARSDYCQSLSQFFGPAPHNLAPNPEAKRPHEAYFLPDAFKGRNDFLSNTIVDVVIAQNSFMTRHVLPMQHREDPTLRWASFSFDRTLADYEPEQGVPRYVTLKSSSREDYMQRRGLAFYMNHGFANTDMGRMDFKMKIAAIVNAIKETLDQEALLAILNAKNMYKAQETKAARALTTVEARMALARDRWACVQKEERGWLMLDADLSDSMNRQGVHPDTWIVPPRMAMYATIAQPAETEYYRAGPAARRNLAENGSEKSYTRWRGSTLYEIKPYHLDNDDVDLCHLERERVIGDYFVIRDFAFGRYPKEDGHYTDGQVQQQATLTDVYCCESDKFETFKLADAIKKTGVFEDDMSGYSRAFETWFENDFKGTYDLDELRRDELLERDTMAFSEKGKKLFMPCMHVDGVHGHLELIPITDGEEGAQRYMNDMRVAGWVSRDDCHPPHAELMPCPEGSAVAMLGGSRKDALCALLTSAFTSETTMLTMSGLTDLNASSAENMNALRVLCQAASKCDSHCIEEYTTRYTLYMAITKALDNNEVLFATIAGHATTDTPESAAVHQGIGSALGGFVLHSTEAMATSVVPVTQQYKQTVRKGVHWLRALNDEHGMTRRQASQSTRLLQDMRPALMQPPQHEGSAHSEQPSADTLRACARSLYALGIVAGDESIIGELDDRALCQSVAVARAALQFANQHVDASGLDSDDELRHTAAVESLRAITDTVRSEVAAQGPGAAQEDVDQKALIEFMSGLKNGTKSRARTELLKYMIGSEDHMQLWHMASFNEPKTFKFGGAAKLQRGRKVSSITKLNAVIEHMCTSYVELRDLLKQKTTDDFDVVDAKVLCRGQWALLGVGIDAVALPVCGLMSTLCHDFCTPEENTTAATTRSDWWLPSEQLQFRKCIKDLDQSKYMGFDIHDSLERSSLRTSSFAWSHRHELIQNPKDSFENIVHHGIYADFLHRVSGDKNVSAKALISELKVNDVNDIPDIRRGNVFPKSPPWEHASDTSDGNSDTKAWLGNAFSVLCSRPFRSYTMGSAIKCKAGKDLGVTAHGYEDMQLSDNIISHVYVGHFTIWAAAVVFNEKLACVIDDIFCSGYNGGEGRRFVDRKNWINDEGYADPYRYVLHDGDGGRGCIFAYLMPPHFDNAASATFEWNCAQNPIDITGTLHTHETSTAAPSERDYRFPCAKANTEWWMMNNLRDSNPSAEACEEYSEKYYAPETVVNTVCFQTMQTVVGGSGKAGDLHRGAAIWNTDHFGREGVYAGVKGVRTGKLAHFKDQGYEGRYVTL